MKSGMGDPFIGPNPASHPCDTGSEYESDCDHRSPSSPMHKAAAAPKNNPNSATFENSVTTFARMKPPLSDPTGRAPAIRRRDGHATVRNHRWGSSGRMPFLLCDVRINENPGKPENPAELGRCGSYINFGAVTSA